MIALPIGEHVSSEWSVLCRQIGLVREKGLQIEIVDIVLDILEYVIHGLLGSTAIPYKEKVRGFSFLASYVMIFVKDGGWIAGATWSAAFKMT